jgi:hypothetical protein
MNEPRSPRRTRSRDASARKASSEISSAAQPEAPRSTTRPVGTSQRARRSSTEPRAARSRDASVVAVDTAIAVGRVGFVYPPCGRFMPTEVDGLVLRARWGSPPRFCSPSCRQAAYRRPQAGVAEDVALQLRGGRGRSLVQARRGRR